MTFDPSSWPEWDLYTLERSDAEDNPRYHGLVRGGDAWYKVESSIPSRLTGTPTERPVLTTVLFLIMSRIRAIGIPSHGDREFPAVVRGNLATIPSVHAFLRGQCKVTFNVSSYESAWDGNLDEALERAIAHFRAEVPDQQTALALREQTALALWERSMPSPEQPALPQGGAVQAPGLIQPASRRVRKREPEG